MRDAIDFPDAVPAVYGMSKIDTIETSECHDGLCRAVAVFDRLQLDSSRLERRNPEQRLPIGFVFGVAGEIATPNAWKIRPGAPSKGS